MKLLRLIIVFPILALGLLPSLHGAGAPENPKEIVITAKRFDYSPKEVRLKKGETVTLVLKSQDVTHGLFCRKLKIDTDIPPGQETRVTVTPGPKTSSWASSSSGRTPTTTVAG